jgi:hypothetical protein
MSSTRPFRAFVSYCHSDKAFAARLQRRLESYRLPRRLAGQLPPLPGQAPGRIGPIFRDREDLSAATDLSAAVRDAIAASSALVVVASPAAAASHWVEREIELFRELHPGAPILVALAEGEPCDALPVALRSDHAEPLCADFRKEGDGRRLAFLKIVAGLADLPLDTLVQRDAQRQMRRVMAVTFGAAVLVVIMALLLVMALRAREEAEFQRVQAEQRRADAEGLVEFMLTDLRERLRGVDRLDIMSAVNKRAMAYYTAQGDLSRLTDDALDRRSRILHAMGEDEEQGAHLAPALAKFTEAHRTTGAILARRPSEGNAIFAHAQSEYWVGYVAWRQGNRATATRHWNGYLGMARRLASVERGSIRGLVEQAYAEGGLCDLAFSESHDLLAAAKHCQAGISFASAALAKSPDDRQMMQDLANRHGWMARVQLARKEYAAALASRRMEASILDRLLRLDPDNAQYGLRRSWPDIGTARILMELGKSGDAAKLLETRWHAFRPTIGAEKGSLYCESGLRIVLHLAKAQRAAGLSRHEVTESEGRALLQRCLDLFPARKERIAALVKDIG